MNTHDHEPPLGEMPSGETPLPGNDLQEIITQYSKTIAYWLNQAKPTRRELVEIGLVATLAYVIGRSTATGEQQKNPLPDALAEAVTSSTSSFEEITSNTQHVIPPWGFSPLQLYLPQEMLAGISVNFGAALGGGATERDYQTKEYRQLTTLHPDKLALATAQPGITHMSTFSEPYTIVDPTKPSNEWDSGWLVYVPGRRKRVFARTLGDTPVAYQLHNAPGLDGRFLHMFISQKIVDEAQSKHINDHFFALPYPQLDKPKAPRSISTLPNISAYIAVLS